jgi:AMMECR1 domain-containing protein
MHGSWLRFAAGTVFLGLLAACTAPEVHVHDRHVLSYPLVQAFAKVRHRGTLVLLDRHHDVAPTDTGVSSFNWVAATLDEGLVSRVIWVSERTLPPPTRQSRQDWLRRSLEGTDPIDAARIVERVSIADWDELRRLHLRGPILVSLDLDLFDDEAKDPRQQFLDEIAGWIAERKPRLLTVALSAAYQPDAAAAWARLERFVRTFPGKGAEWYLEAGAESPAPESREETQAWRLWEERPDAFGRYAAGFQPGAANWIEAPPGVREALAIRAVRPGDRSAVDVLSGWIDADRLALERDFPAQALESLAAAAAKSLEDAWTGAVVCQPQAGSNAPGLAVRLTNRGQDRGCLALYNGVMNPDAAVRYCAQAAASDPRYPPIRSSERGDLRIEISLFGPWRGMKDPMDFRPCLDSVLLSDGGRVTLLQSSLAVERSCDREAFLRILAKKAGLGEDGWRDSGITFRRAATIRYTRPFAPVDPGS